MALGCFHAERGILPLPPHTHTPFLRMPEQAGLPGKYQQTLFSYFFLQSIFITCTWITYDFFFNVWKPSIRFGKSGVSMSMFLKAFQLILVYAKVGEPLPEIQNSFMFSNFYLFRRYPGSAIRNYYSWQCSGYGMIVIKPEYICKASTLLTVQP